MRDFSLCYNSTGADMLDVNDYLVSPQCKNEFVMDLRSRKIGLSHCWSAL